MVQWLRLHAFNTGELRSHRPRRGMPRSTQKNTNTKQTKSPQWTMERKAPSSCSRCPLRPSRNSLGAFLSRLAFWCLKTFRIFNWQFIKIKLPVTPWIYPHCHWHFVANKIFQNVNQSIRVKAASTVLSGAMAERRTSLLLGLDTAVQEVRCPASWTRRARTHSARLTWSWTKRGEGSTVLHPWSPANTPVEVTKAPLEH